MTLKHVTASFPESFYSTDQRITAIKAVRGLTNKSFSESKLIVEEGGTRDLPITSREFTFDLQTGKTLTRQQSINVYIDRLKEVGVRFLNCDFGQNPEEAFEHAETNTSPELLEELKSLTVKAVNQSYYSLAKALLEVLNQQSK
jgi:hypothetical protein